jgi:hypothetical protein
LLECQTNVFKWFVESNQLLQAQLYHVGVPLRHFVMVVWRILDGGFDGLLKRVNATITVSNVQGEMALTSLMTLETSSVTNAF